MKIAVFAVVALLAGCGQSNTDKQLERVIARLDSIESKVIDQADEMETRTEKIEKEIDDLDTAVENVDCTH